MKISSIYNNYQTKNNPINSSSSKIMYRPNATIPFGEYWVREIEESYRNQQDEITKKIDDYFKTQNGGQLIATGDGSKVYTVDNLPGIVIKNKNDIRHKYDMEARYMRVMSNVIDDNQQQYVATITDEDSGKTYLLSTQADGIQADPIERPWTPEKLDYFFDLLLKMDKAGIWHGDLNAGNVLLEENGDRVNLIDYEWTRKLNPELFFKENANCNLPPFAYMMNNAQFEMTGLPEYISKFDDENKAQEFLKDYLKSKAKYHLNRSEMYDEIPFNNEEDEQAKEISRRYDLAQYAVLKDPSEAVMKLEAKKIQFLSAYKDAFKYQDDKNEKRNIMVAPAASLFTLSCIQDYRREVERFKQQSLKESNNKLSPEVKDYIKSMEEYGNWWLFSACQWMEDLGDMPMRHIKGTLKQWEGKPVVYENPKDMDICGNMTNILPKLGKEYEPEYTRNIPINTEELENYKIRIGKTIENLINNHLMYNETKATLPFDHLQRINLQKMKLDRGNFWLNCLTSYYSMLYFAHHYEDDLRDTENYDETRIAYKNSCLVLAKELVKDLTKMTTSAYRTIFLQMLQDGPKTGELTGYSNMSDFDKNTYSLRHVTFRDMSAGLFPAY